MKTQVIQLEHHDDVVSTRDKMAWANSARILLVCPPRLILLTNRVDLVIIQRYGQELGAQVGLVTQDRDAQELAAEIGMPVFPSVEGANRQPWRRLRRRKRVNPNQQWSRRLKKRSELEAFHETAQKERIDRPAPLLIRILAFGLGCCAFLALVLFFLPSARIHIAVSEKEQSVSFKIWTNPDIQTPNLSGGIPALVTKVTVESQDQIKSSGNQIVPDRRAGGFVTFTNLTGKSVEVPAGTIVRTLVDPPVRFLTSEPLQIPAGPDRKAVVAITAAIPGANGNVGANLVTGIEGEIGVSLAVNNSTVITGGTDRNSLAPNLDDYKALKNRLLDSLQKMALAQIQKQLQPGQKLVPGSLKQGSIISEERHPAEDLPGDQLQLKMSIEYQAWYYSELDLHEVALTALDASLPEGFQTVDPNLTITNLTIPVLENGSARWDVIAIRKIRSGLPSSEIIQTVLGKTSVEAAKGLQTRFGFGKAPRIDIFPSWWPRLPYLPFRVEVVAE